MNWLHAFRMGGGQLREDQVDVVRAAMATYGYRTEVDMWFIEKVYRGNQEIYVRRLFGGDANMREVHEDILARLPADLISLLNGRFGNARPHSWDDDEAIEVFIDEMDQSIKATPNVGAATVLPLPK
jgi:hypothetical protein